VLRAAYASHPERFPRGIPSPPRLPEAVWINKPKNLEVEQESDALSAPHSDDLYRPRVRVLPISGNEIRSKQEVAEASLP
jgi:hypothetical protein